MTYLRATVRWTVTAAMVFAATGSATAQPGGSAPAAGAGAGAQVVGSERRPQLTLQEELAQSDLVLSRIEQASGVVRRQLEGARKARDVVKTLCLNDKLSQIDVANRSAKDRQAALQSAVQRNDLELANHEFTIITVLRQRVEQLTAEANQCIGEELAFIGQTQVSMTVDPDQPAPNEDLTTPEPSTDLGGLGPPPTCMTCAM